MIKIFNKNVPENYLQMAEVNGQLIEQGNLT